MKKLTQKHIDELKDQGEESLVHTYITYIDNISNPAYDEIEIDFKFLDGFLKGYRFSLNIPHDIIIKNSIIKN